MFTAAGLGFRFFDTAAFTLQPEECRDDNDAYCLVPFMSLTVAASGCCIQPLPQPAWRDGSDYDLHSVHGDFVRIC